MKRLHGADTAFLYLGDADQPPARGVGGGARHQPLPEAASAGAVAELLRTRLDRVPPLRRRLASTRLGLSQPNWIDVDVNPADHVVTHDAADLERIAGAVLSRPLDHRRPLWGLHSVPGLAGNPGRR